MNHTDFANIYKFIRSGIRIISLISILTVFHLTAPLELPAAGTGKTAITLLPFSVVSQNNADLMKNGIDTILRNRLSGIGTITTPDKPERPEEMIRNAGDALRLASPFKGSHVIYGSVVKFGETVTTDAFLIDTASGQPLVHFQESGNGDGAVISHITRFADQVLAILASSDTTIHSPAKTAVNSEKSSLFQWKSKRFDERIVGMVAGNLNGDSSRVIAVAFDRKVVFYLWENDTLTEKSVIRFANNQSIMGIDSADVNGNGIPEIFVSVIANDHRSFSSTIVEWDGSHYKTIQSDLKWIFRSYPLPDHGKNGILCQKHDSPNGIFGSPVCFFEYKNGLYGPGAPIPGTESLNMYSLALNRTTDNPLTAYYDIRHRIKAQDKTGAPAWESDEQFGGGAIYLSVKNETDRDKTDLYYMEPRLIFCRLFSLDSCDLIAVKNNESTHHLFSGYKSYTNGQIVIFSRNLTGFSQTYTTPAATGYISDFCLFDFTGDKRDDLMYSVVTGNSNFFGKQSSYIVIQELQR